VKSFTLQSFAVLNLLVLGACSHGPRQASPPPEARGPIENFTGVVVKVDEGYRFKPLNQPENLQRFTHAKGGTDLQADEINLRKYFGKTLVVKGDSRHGWLLRAVVVGQWNRPGETRGPTLTGPEPKATPAKE
jgi:hypothetical protein